MVFQRFMEEGLAHFSYVLGDDASGEAVILDPRRDGDVYLDWIEGEGLSLTGIVETHLHADYASGAHELAVKNGVPHYLSAYDEGEKYRARYEHVGLKEGNRISIGSLELEALHTPGHTPEHLSYLLYADADGDGGGPLRMFSGDFLFVGSLGRPDLIGEEVKRELASKLYDSVQKLKSMDLPDDMRIHPAHGAGSLCGAGLEEMPESTLGRERRENPYFRIEDREEFVEAIFDALGDYPPYYRRMKETNSRGAEPVLPIDSPDALKPDDVKTVLDRGDEVVLLDVRPRRDYGEAHVPGSLNIEGTSDLNTWAPWVIPYETPIYLVASRSTDTGELEAVYRRLLRVELDEVVGYLEGGFEAWVEAGYPVESLEQLNPDELKARLRDGEVFVLDVRTPDEYAEDRIPGALNIPVGRLPDRLDELSVPPERQVVTVCGSGYRSSLAGSILLRNGFEGVGHLIGGFEHWRESGGDAGGSGNAKAV